MKKILLALFLLTSFAGYSQWTEQAIGISTPSTGVRHISVVDSNIVWLCTYDGSGGGANRQDYSRTVDGGNTWISGTVPVSSDHDWSMIHAVSATTAWAMFYNATAGTGGGIWNTVDGGATWTQQGVGTIFDANSFPNVVYFWDALNGMAMGDPNPTDFDLYTTTDGGLTWNQVPGANIPNALSGEYGIVGHFDVIDSTVWFDTNKARVYKSTDRGMTWTVAATGITMPATEALDIAFTTATQGLAVYSNSSTGLKVAVRQTNDGGTTWTPVTVSGTLYPSDLAHIPGTTTLVSTGAFTGNTGSSYSLDGGVTWLNIDAGTQRTAVGFANDHTGWAGNFTVDSLTGGVYKYTGAPLVVGINEITGKEIYFNVFPNPSSGNFNVQLAGGYNTTTELCIFDLTGKEVYREMVSNGSTFEKYLNVSDLSKGIYTLRVTNGKLTERKKIVIQ